MSSLQRTAHVTGLNNPFPNQYGGPSSVYRPVGGGAPGILAGVPAGFTVAVGLHVPAPEGTDLWAQFGPQASPPLAFPLDVSVPATEFLVGAFDFGSGNGWTIAREGDVIDCAVGTIEAGMADLAGGVLSIIALASFVADDTPYGGLGDASLGTGSNGNPGVDYVVDVNDFLPQAEFVIGGTIDGLLAPVADSGLIGGCFRTQLNSFWITEGIPTSDQANDFMAQSMQAGQVIPAAWAPVRTVANPTPATPDAPTGHHWSATDVALSDGLGGIWTDRISGVELERVGFENDDTRERANGHNYFTPPG
jgi:hypothetical protein